MSNTLSTSDGIYPTHDNGGTPFSVRISTNPNAALDITVHLNRIQPYVQEQHGHLNATFYKRFILSKKNWLKLPPGRYISAPDVSIATYHDAACFVGKSGLCTMTAYSAGHGDEFDGNTILIQPDLTRLDYVYVGHCIYQFTALYPIVKYESPVGNSDVPYPYAVDEMNNHYLMLESVVLTKFKEHECFQQLVSDLDPYDYYWRRNGNKFSNLWFYDRDSDENKNISIKTDYEHVHRVAYSPSFVLRPGCTYFVHVEAPGAPVSLNMETISPWSEDAVLSAIANFGVEKGYLPMTNKIEIHKRRP